MELIECTTCGAHSFTNNKCDYCGNQYKVEEHQEYQDLYDDDKHAKRVYGKTYCDDEIEAYAHHEVFYKNEFLTISEREEDEELGTILDSFEDKKGNETATKIMVWILISIIWFAVTVVIPPLFIITIILLVVYGIKCLTKRKK